MFVHHCSSCEKRQLIFPSQVTSLANVEDGFGVRFTCWCGSEQSHVLERATVDA